MKKQLLSENEIRKFMKFANLKPLANGFVDKLNEQEMAAPEEEPEEEAKPEEE